MYVLLKKGLKISNKFHYSNQSAICTPQKYDQIECTDGKCNQKKKKTIAVELWAIRTGILHCNTFLLKWVFAFHLCKKMLEKRIIGRT